MHNRRFKMTISDYAKILIVMAFALLIYGIILDFSNSVRLINPQNVVKKDDNNTFVDVVRSSDNNKDKDSDTKENTGDYYHKQDNTNKFVNSVDEINDQLREKLQKLYGITIKYGDEVGNYSVGGYNTTNVTDSVLINDSLVKLKNSLSLYPNGLFDEIKNTGGISLSIYLLNNYSDDTITGVTDSTSKYAIISVAVSHPFEETFYHESYHYMERYMLKKGVNFNSWNIYNPSGFSYGIINKDYSYTSTYSQNAFFVNNYAQYSAEEDRASTFEYMMATNKALCMNQGTPVWSKARVMKEAIEVSFSSVSPNVVEYWERFI